MSITPIVSPRWALRPCARRCVHVADSPVAETLKGTGRTNDHITVTGPLQMNDTRVKPG
ncbi:MAG: hypothetical protein WBP81_27180 [Solirubrobacteraceae bacterium]